MAKNKLPAAIDAAINQEGSPPLVYHPPGYKTSTKVKKVTQITDVRNNLIRIQHEADPIGFLIACLTGMMFEVHYVGKDGQICTILEQAPIGQRIKIAQFLANKQLPSLSIMKHVLPDGGGEPGAGGGSNPQPGGAGMTFAQIVARAAAQAGEPPKVVDVEHEEVEENK